MDTKGAVERPAESIPPSQTPNKYETPVSPAEHVETDKSTQFTTNVDHRRAATWSSDPIAAAMNIDHTSSSLHSTTLPKLPVTSNTSHYEVLLHGSVYNVHEQSLIAKLRAMCPCTPPEEFWEHELVFGQNLGTRNPYVLRMRRCLGPQFKTNALDQYPFAHHSPWLFKYTGRLEPDAKCPTLLRKSMEAYMAVADPMGFIKMHGLRYCGEHAIHGWQCVDRGIRITVSRASTVKRPGQLNDLVPINTESAFVEASILNRTGEDYMPIAEQLVAFCANLEPLCPMQKIDYEA